jgi:hypothetical protein
MTYSEEQKWSVLDEAKRTLERTSPERLAETRPVFEERFGGASVIHAEPPQDRLTKWRREVDELEAERDRDRELLALVHGLQDSARLCRQDIASGLAAVNKFADVIKDRLEEPTEENAQLSAKLSLLETRFNDLKQSFDSRGAQATSSTADVIDLPNKPRRA